jgi:hypothetical protein
VTRPAETLSLALLVGLALGCAAGDTAAEAPDLPAPPAWVQDPAASWDEQAEPLSLRVTGSAAIGESLGAAEAAARADALALIAAFLDGAQVLVDARGSQPAAVATAVQSARVRGKFHDGRRYFVWMAADAGLVLPDDAPAAARDELARLVARRNRG